MPNVKEKVTYHKNSDKKLKPIVFLLIFGNYFIFSRTNLCKSLNLFFYNRKLR